MRGLPVRTEPSHVFPRQAFFGVPKGHHRVITMFSCFPERQPFRVSHVIILLHHVPMFS